MKWAAAFALLGACAELDPSSKVDCDDTGDCLNGYACIARACVLENAALRDGGDGGDGDGDGDQPPDQQGPESVALWPEGGTYNRESGFECVRVLGIEPGGRADFFKLEENGSVSFQNDGTVTADDSEICDFAEGRTTLSVSVYDAAGNLVSETAAVYQVDRTAPLAPLAPESGLYAVADLYDDVADPGDGYVHVRVYGESTASIYYELSRDGSLPVDPSTGSPEAKRLPGVLNAFDLTAFEIDEITRAGWTSIKLWQVDAAGNSSEVVSFDYEIDLDVFDFNVEPSGPFNLDTAPECVVVYGIEEGAQVFYEVGDESPSSLSPAVGAEEPTICGFARDGEVTLSLQAQDTAGNLGPVRTFTYELDLVRPTIQDFTHDATTGLGYLYHPIRFELTSEPGAQAWVQLGEREIALFDDGTSGDLLADDGVYARGYVPLVEDHMPSTVPVANAMDAAGNAAVTVMGSAVAIDAEGSTLPYMVSSDTTCATASTPCVIEGSVVVQNGATLTVEAGAVLSFSPGARLTVLGALRIVGSTEAPVLANAGSIRLEGELGHEAAFDGDRNYVRGPRLEGLHMPEGTVQVLTGNGVLFVRDSFIGSLLAERFYGTLIERSRIGTFSHPEMWWAETGAGTRLLNSYFNIAYLQAAGPTGSEATRIERCSLTALSIYGWNEASVLAGNIVHRFGVTRPDNDAGVLVAHGNNFGIAVSGTILMVSFLSAQGMGTHDLTGNYWGTATAQMQALGDDANITAISDARDHPFLDLVDYSDFKTAPFENAGPDWDL